MWQLRNNLTLDVQEDVLAPPLPHPVGRLAHVVPRLALVDPLEDEAEVGEDDAVLGRVRQSVALPERNMRNIITSKTDQITLNVRRFISRSKTPFQRKNMKGERIQQSSGANTNNLLPISAI